MSSSEGSAGLARELLVLLLAVVLLVVVVLVLEEEEEEVLAPVLMLWSLLSFDMVTAERDTLTQSGTLSFAFHGWLAGSLCVRVLANCRGWGYCGRWNMGGGGCE